MYHCDLCKKNFSRSDSFQRHQKLHTGEKPFVCVACNRTFSRSDNLQKHIKTHSTSNEGNVVVDISTGTTSYHDEEEEQQQEKLNENGE